MQMVQPLKPPRLRLGDGIRIVSLGSPVDEARLARGCGELARLGYAVEVNRPDVLARDGFFAGSTRSRVEAFKLAFCEATSRAIFCTRGGYGSNYLLDSLHELCTPPKIFCGFSDMTSVQIFLWQKLRWVTLYGPMAASGIDGGANAPGGYEPESLLSAMSETERGWAIDLEGESLAGGVADGALLGGCLTLVETTLGTPWELDTAAAILVLEDRDMRPYQVDRALMHLKQAGKFEGVAGVILGEFPESHEPWGTETVKDVAQRILGPRGIPIVWGAAVGHTPRAMITLPLGVRARLSANAQTKLEILEPAVR
jgi:muramoyltetrapeptide carboxypeptidase